MPRQVIAELLRFLKRSYWPFAWDSSAAGGSSSGAPFFQTPNQLLTNSAGHRQPAENPNYTTAIVMHSITA